MYMPSQNTCLFFTAYIWEAELNYGNTPKSLKCKPFGLTVCQLSYPAVVADFNIYENQ